MEIQLSGAQIVGFLILVATIAPGLMAVGAMWSRLVSLEKWRDAQDPIEARVVKMEASTEVLLESRRMLLEKVDKMSETLQRLLGRTETPGGGEQKGVEGVRR